MRDSWDDYLINGTNVLINKFNETSKEKLQKLEQESVLIKLTTLNLNPIINEVSFESLKQLHEFIFCDVYPFAGKIRTCTLSKNGYNFLPPEMIDSECRETILKYSSQIDKVSSVGEYAFVLAPFYYDLIRIHPFREGNGRTIREFLREVVLLKNKVLPFDVELDYTKVNKDNLMLGTKERYFYPSMLEMEFMNSLIPLEKSKKL